MMEDVLKKELRTRMKRLRSSIPEKTRKEKAFAAMKHLLETNLFRDAKTIALFSSIGSEIDTAPVHRALYKEGKLLVYPRVVGHEIVFAPGMEECDFVVGTMGIREPVTEPTNEIDCIIIPGLAFSKSGYRLGYGGGYYDRYLEKYPDPLRIGYGFSEQWDIDVPVMEWDLPLDAFVSDRGLQIVECSRIICAAKKHAKEE